MPAHLSIVPECAESPDAHQQEQASSRDLVIDELRRHTLAFGEAISEALVDFFDLEASFVGGSQAGKGYCPQGDVHLSIPFSGLVNGEYIVNLDESVAAQIVGLGPDEPQDEKEREERREELGQALSELLNTAVGMVIGELSGRYPHLSFASPRISFGVRVYPLIRIGLVDLGCEYGSIRCHFYVDHMELDLATSYAKIQASAEQTRAALTSHVHMVERILERVNSGIFWIREDRSIGTRVSKSTPKILGLGSSELEGSFPELLAKIYSQHDVVEKIESWLERVFASQSIEQWSEEVEPDCPIAGLESPERFSWRWIPVRVQGERPCSLLVAVDLARQGSQLSYCASSDELVEQLALAGWVLMTQEAL